MAGTAITPPAAAGGNVPPNPPYTPSFLNSFRIAAVAERLELHIRNPSKIDTVEFYNLCLSLARGLDYAAANNQIPNRVQELPLLLKRVCKLSSDYLLQSAIMVLMISVKNACRTKWFRPADCEELLTLANEVGNNFCSVKDMNTEASNSEQTISKVMSRYYPRMKIGQILVCLEAKPGFGTFVVDFFIEKHNKTKEKICLFAIQTDNLETSSCIISPQQVNFLLNGKGVERRTNVFMDPGPLLPTVVTSMLKYGTNLLQAVGQFKGNFIIIVAFMSVVSNLERPALQDCDSPTMACLSGSDSEVIEGPSRISLNCPISFTRIKTPVKGHLCKHLQCFDYENFVDMNSRRPSWRCPHCNQGVSYLDIRVDQNLVKVLREVDDNITDIIISADGSWKVVVESSETKDQPHDKTPQDNVSIPQDICDLTEENYDMEVDKFANETLEEKPNLASLQAQSNLPPPEANQNLPRVEDDYWMGMYLSSYGSARNAGHNSGSAPTNSMLPVLTDAVSPTTIQHSPIGLSLNLSEVENNFSNEYGRVPPPSRHSVTRTPVAVQALPAQPSTPSPRYNGFDTSVPPLGVLPLPPISDISERQHQLLRSQLNKTSPSPPPPPHSTDKVNNTLNHEIYMYLRRQQQKQAQNSGVVPVPQVRSHIPRNQMAEGGTRQNEIHQQLAAAVAASQRATQRGRHLQPPSGAVAIQTTRQPLGNQRVNLSGGTPQAAAAARTDGGSSPNLPPEQNWRPTSRMRGALSGPAYSEALNQIIIQPTQQPAARPTPNIASPPPGLPSHLQVLLANNRNAHIAPPSANLPQSQPANTYGSTGVLPDASSGMPPAG